MSVSRDKAMRPDAWQSMTLKEFASGLLGSAGVIVAIGYVAFAVIDVTLFGDCGRIEGHHSTIMEVWAFVNATAMISLLYRRGQKCNRFLWCAASGAVLFQVLVILYAWSQHGSRVM
jgi:hypothetical protein